MTSASAFYKNSLIYAPSFPLRISSLLAFLLEAQGFLSVENGDGSTPMANLIGSLSIGLLSGATGQARRLKGRAVGMRFLRVVCVLVFGAPALADRHHHMSMIRKLLVPNHPIENVYGQFQP